MIAVEEALALVLQQQRAYGSEEVALLQCIGRILAKDLVADRDYPAFNRVMMDGIAIDIAAFDAGVRAFQIEGIQAAGDPPASLADARSCIEVMTGAVLPGNTNAVIPYEVLEISASIATVLEALVVPYQHVHRQGADSRKGAVLLVAGTRLTAAHIGILAAAGMQQVTVKRLPRVAVCSTGNELVALHEQPLPHQIRQSNGYMLAAALQQEGIPADLFHLADDRTEMTGKLAQITTDYEVVLLSGAVSKGKYDYLPEVLTALGMDTIFHRIAQKPGKPLLFGSCENGTIVFGFPGNPVSTFVCYQVYFRAWLNHSLQYSVKKITAKLDQTITFSPRLAYHVQVALRYQDGELLATPVMGTNSGDMPGLAAAEGIMTLPADQELFAKGALFNLITFS
jgi:molybdopterin molybdotransferase